ncbi:Uncharacterised protein [Streptococcus criceti]|nr:Uncharacterised protein [Streptococcus criceti]
MFLLEIISFMIESENMNDNITSGLIGAVVVGFLTLIVAYTDYRRSLDGDSKWRSKLFDAASAPEITLKEVQTLRTALRYDPIKGMQKNTFDWISNIMIYYCDYLGLKYFKRKASLSYQEQEIVRVFIRCLLKNHWEFNASMISSLRIFKNHNNRSKQRDFIRETYEKVDRICKTVESNDEKDLIEKLNEQMMGKN